MGIPKDRYKNVWLPLFLLVVVLLIDYFTPLHIAVGILYSSTILVSLKASKRRIIGLAIVASIFIIANFIYFSSLESQMNWVFPVNRLTSLIGLWITTFIAINFKKVSERLLKERTDYSAMLEELIFANSHKVRKPLANIVKLVDLMEEENISVEDLKEMLPLLAHSAAELEVVTREMTDSISRKEYNQDLLSPSI